jgi:hypothetical protein
MKRAISFFFILFIQVACTRSPKANFRDDVLTFRLSLRPSFDETAEIVLSKIDTQQRIQFLIMDREWSDKPVDTFYFRTMSLPEDQFRNFDSSVIQKTKMRQPHQWTGCCDGMPVTFQVIRGTDTSKLYFRSPYINLDSSGYELTKGTINYLGKLFNDSIITDYLEDIETYMDESRQQTKWTRNRAIDRLRKIEYSR